MRWSRLVLAVVLAAAAPLLLAGPAQAAKVVDVDNMQYTPQTVRITVGHAVKWTFNDNVAHTVTGSGWGSGVKQPGETYRHVFRRTGTFRYHCTIHPDMTGKVVVRAARPHPTGLRTGTRSVLLRSVP
ncbi:MAG TPA: plastocyanin/azurin family copper-binding protein [Nocardioides sp.]|nr:plastocyanin/azurin family copper-binding protein [Nocardioides sp.]